MPSQNASVDDTHYGSTQIGTTGNEVPDISTMVPSQQIISMAEVLMSELIEGSAPVRNPLETEAESIGVAGMLSAA